LKIAQTPAVKRDAATSPGPLRIPNPRGKIDPPAATIIPAMAKFPAEDTSVRASDDQPIDWRAELAQHQRWLRTIVAARLGERDAVEDVLQEVSLAAVKQAAPIRDSAKVAPWLYRLAVRQCLLYRRRAGRQRKLVTRYGESFQPQERDNRTLDPLAWLLADERRRLVRQALGRLHHRDAEILLLKYTEDWSYHQIAEHLGISHAAVETRLHRARARLRSELAEYQPEAQARDVQSTMQARDIRPAAAPRVFREPA
jgi:RNA polymerase sigma-70 factor (ECF subfamily)